MIASLRKRGSRGRKDETNIEKEGGKHGVKGREMSNQLGWQDYSLLFVYNLILLDVAMLNNSNN